MVNDSGQIYTIEGLAAAILMVVTAYLVVSTTTVLTPQDVHIIDMQLQQMGNDALAMMDTPDSYGTSTNRANSTLALAIATNNTTLFQTTFLTYVNSTTNSTSLSKNDTMSYQAVVYYRNTTDMTNSFVFNSSTYYRENAVRVSRWVYLPNFTNTSYPDHPDLRNSTQSVLLEVLLWRA